MLQEHETRFAVWKDNLKYILDYNSEHTSHKVRRFLQDAHTLHSLSLLGT